MKKLFYSNEFILPNTALRYALFQLLSAAEIKYITFGIPPCLFHEFDYSELNYLRLLQTVVDKIKVV